MNLKNMFKDFNPSKFLVFFSLLLFSFLFALRLDGSILWSYWIIFLPIWIWKVTVISGALVGSYIWWKHPQYRMENNNYTQYKAMVISTGMHLLLLMFEILACDNLAVGAEHHPWILVFIPLMFMSVISIGICVWAFKNDRTFELELFCSVNILQFIFLALRLDNTVKWSWVIVFIPLWILMCLALIGVLYLIVLAIILLKNASIIPEQRRGNFSSALRYAFLVVPLLVFEILLANKLDGDNQLKYIAVVIPLCISLATLMCFSFGAKAGNVWWFGIRMDFCQFLLGKCPILQEYGNISYSLHGDESQENDLVNRPRNLAKPDSSRQNKDIIFDQKIIVPIISIETPD